MNLFLLTVGAIRWGSDTGAAGPKATKASTLMTLMTYPTGYPTHSLNSQGTAWTCKSTCADHYRPNTEQEPEVMMQWYRWTKFKPWTTLPRTLFSFFKGETSGQKTSNPQHDMSRTHVVLPWHFGTKSVMPISSSGFEYFVHLRTKKVCDFHEARKLLGHTKKPPQHGWPWKSHSALAGLSDCKNCSFRLLFGLASSCLLLLCFWTLMKGKSLISHHQNNAFCLLAAFFSFRRRSTSQKKNWEQGTLHQFSCG